MIFRSEALKADVPLMAGADHVTTRRDQFTWGEERTPALEFSASSWSDADVQSSCVIVMLRDAALSGGADDFLTKPVNRLELQTRVKSLLRVRHLASERDRLLAYLEEMEQQILNAR